ncbi:MAG: glycosyltransferase family 4 protein [Altibacter sp.]|uniref:glycosyltransferase family 4 protein n=1 Tax=Altibacter sp. TaxID=2024823 RepID=UPI001D89EC99|nr:glycosyltransferase family 4 protein [Altibacter sp.]MBZ0326207.1 glycosyltransferase family 4 protein [Altibacter sp.]
MRVLQLIDSLHAGGAERMAVTLANTLSERLEGSYLCATRAEGVLKESILPATNYIFLNKKGTLDLSALWRLRKFIKQHKIIIVHAHTTSYFFAALLKLTLPKLSVIWHEHHGNRVSTKRTGNKMLYLSSIFFSKIITVNVALREWCKQQLATKQVYYVPNFVVTSSFSEEIQVRQTTIVCLANLREPKNHLNLLKAFKKIHQQIPNWKLQLVGSDYNDDYSDALKHFISTNRLTDAVELLGGNAQPEALLLGAAIGVLSSDSEGLPMALLEYGASGLAVVTTRVGYCEEVISTFGKTVLPNNPEALSEALLQYINDPDTRKNDAAAFKKHIEAQYSQNAILPKLLALYKK